MSLQWYHSNRTAANCVLARFSFSLISRSKAASIGFASCVAFPEELWRYRKSSQNNRRSFSVAFLLLAKSHLLSAVIIQVSWGSPSSRVPLKALECNACSRCDLYISLGAVEYSRLGKKLDCTYKALMRKKLQDISEIKEGTSKSLIATSIVLCLS